MPRLHREFPFPLKRTTGNLAVYDVSKDAMCVKKMLANPDKLGKAIVQISILK